jgi:UDP-N-acetyl-D-mannosaminuronic acid dehydrogenase
MDLVSVSGLGKAGLPLVAVIAEAGIPVIGIDVNEKVVEQVNKGIPPFVGEPGLKELLTKHKGKNIIATTDVKKAINDTNAHIVIVPLFIDDDKQCDFSILDLAFTSIGQNLKKEDIVVLETTVPPKTTETRIKEILEKNSKMIAGKDFYLAYSPERIMTGYSISRFSEFPKVIGGINEISTKKAFELYSKFGNMKKVKDARTAELVKVSEGLYRDVNIALANEILKVCDNYEVNFWEMREAASHQFCNIHEPGSVGGHCIPVYPWFIINDMDVPLIKKARLLNDEMINYYADKVDKMTDGKGNVCVIGITYREGVKELAYTRSIPFIKELKNRDYNVFAYDPLMDKNEIEELDVKYLDLKNLNEMDSIVLLNKEKSLLEELKPYKDKILDIKNMFDS